MKYIKLKEYKIEKIIIKKLIIKNKKIISLFKRIFLIKKIKELFFLKQNRAGIIKKRGKLNIFENNDIHRKKPEKHIGIYFFSALIA